MPQCLLQQGPGDWQLAQLRQQWQPPRDSDVGSSGGLRFAYAPGRCRSAPFARLAWGRPLAANELFSLSRLTSAGSSSGLGSSSSSSNVGSGSGYASDSDADPGFSSDVHLEMIDCQICRKPLSKPRKQHGLLPWQWGGRKAAGSSSGGGEFLVCDCCQRCYHKGCCRAQGVSTKERDGVWFHSDACRQCQQGLQQQAKAGPVALPGGRSWQLVDCAPVDPGSGGGLQALKALKKHLSDVLEVLLPAYGPGAARQLVDTNKGYAVLLRQGSLPVTAGLLDVYGQELAVLDLVATVIEEQGNGHCRALLKALEGWLGPQLGVAKLVAVCPADAPPNLQLWQSKFGFKAIPPKDLKAMQASVVPLSFYEDATLLSKQLAKPHRSQQQQQKRKGKDGKGRKAAAGDGSGAQDGDGQPQAAGGPDAQAAAGPDAAAATGGANAEAR